MPDMVSESTALEDGPWMDYFDSEFVESAYFLHERKGSDQTSAIEWFKKVGFFQLAKLSAKRAFEPNFYPEIRPEVITLSPLNRFRYWLFEGIALGDPGSEEEAIDRFGINLSSYPSEFAWKTYIMVRPEAGPNRWRAFEDFLSRGFGIYGGRFISGPTAGRIFAAMGDYYSLKDDKLAILAYELGRKHGVLSNSNCQHLADAYLRQSMWRPALDHYRLVLSSRDATLWTVINAMKCAKQLDAVRTVVHEVIRSKSSWDYFDCRSVLIEAGIRLIQEACDRAMDHIASGDAEHAFALISRCVLQVAKYCEKLTPNDHGRDLLADDTAVRVLILTENNSDRFRSCLGHIEDYLIESSISYQILELVNFLAIVDVLPFVKTIIVYQVRASIEFVVGIEILKKRGLLIIYAVDDDMASAFAQPTLEYYAGFMWESEYVALSVDHLLRRAAAGLCDTGFAGAKLLQGSLSSIMGGKPVVYVPPKPSRATSVKRARGTPDVGLDIGLVCERFLYLDPEKDGCARQILLSLKNNPNIRLICCGPIKADPSFVCVSDRIIYCSVEDFYPDVVIANFRGGDLGEYLTYQAWSVATTRGAILVAYILDNTLPFLKHREHIIRCDESFVLDNVTSNSRNHEWATMLGNSNLILNQIVAETKTTIHAWNFTGRLN